MKYAASEHRQLLEDLTQLNNIIKSRQPVADVDAISIAVAAYVASEADPRAPNRSLSQEAASPNSWFARLRTGATLLVALAVVAGGWQWLRSEAASRKGVAPTTREYATRPAQRATLRLPDGSTVLINSASRVRYAADFGRSSRTIHLDGEALFTVAQHKGVPFVVEAGGVHTRVLGTVFSVRRYATDSAMSVVVAQGKVMAASTVLTTGQTGIGRTDGSVAIDRSADVANSLAWTTGHLAFNYVPLAEAIHELERWYDVRIDVASPEIAKRRVRITLQDETSRQALALIAEAVGAKATWQGRTVTFTLIQRSDK